MPQPSPVPLRPAATTLLLRPGPPWDVFLIQRAATVAFMGGTHVFPGGRVDAQDAAAVDAGQVQHPQPQALADAMALPAAEALAHLSAACREMLEEAGVLLATGAGLTPATPQALRTGLLRKEPWTALLAQQNVIVDGGAMAYVAHWVTPAFEARRFSARFLAALLPAGQEPSIDQHEAVQGAWYTPEAAIAAHVEGRIVLPPPTLTLLDGLTAAATAHQVMARASQPVIRVEPVPVQEEHGMVLAFPGDPEHPEPVGVTGQATRVMVRDGRFVLGSRFGAKQ